MTNPVALATTVWGNGPRRALLLHGLTSAGSTWWRVAEALADRDFTVVAPDMRRHGKSPAGDNLALESHRDDVLMLGGEWDLMIGHSLGGAIAAMIDSASPGFAHKILLEDPAIDSEITASFLDASPEPVAAPTYAQIAAENPKWHARDVEGKLRALIDSGPEVSPQTMADAAPWDTWPNVLAIEVPLMVVAADLEVGSLVTAAVAAALRSRSGTQFVRMAGAGHSPHRDAFDEYFSHLLGFVEG